MERELFQKIIGIIILIALVGSMFAAALIYAPQPPAQNNQPLVPQNQTIYEYNINFQTSVIQELDFIRIAVETSELNKNDIDLEIQSIPGVSRIQSSQFISNNTDKWVYFAEINLRKKINVIDVVNEIFELKFFNGDKQAMKRVSIITPKENIELIHKDANFSRKFLFEYETTFAIVNLETMANDEISVNGTIKLQGNNIVSIELMELENKTNIPEIFFVEKEFELNEVGEELFFEVKGEDFNATYYSEQVNLIEGSMAIPFENSLFGQTNQDNKELLVDLFQDFNLKLNKMATIFINEVFIKDLNKSIDFNTSFNIEVSLDSFTGKKSMIRLEISNGRITTKITNAVESN
ncbi:MAG: hypothetical protein PHX27_01440 [Candidatus ainarchaeum sp.]|nr:hypothetical protein [Candidatus ainarchaeum sp.]